MSWNPTASTLIVAPVSAWKSGARRLSASAICGPSNVSRWTDTPSNRSPPAAGDALPAGGADAAGSETAGADPAGADPAGDGLADGLHAAMIRITLIAETTKRKRDTTGGPSSVHVAAGVQHVEQMAVGWTVCAAGYAESRYGTRFSMLTDDASRNERPRVMSDERATGDGAVFEGESLAPAVTRAAAILDLLAENGSVPAGPSELARRLGLPKSSIANICAALVDTGLVRRVGTGFTLGRKLAELGGAYLTSVDLVQEFYEACNELAAGSEETVQLAVLDGVEMTYLARHDGKQPVRLTSQIGRRLPASVTATGKAALALDRRARGAAAVRRR